MREGDLALKSRVWVEIDLGKLRRNFAKIAARVAPCKVLAVMKANAYGLGVARYAEALGDAEIFGVAEPYEALQLMAAMREGKIPEKPVQMLSAVLPDEIDEMVAAGVTLPVIDTATVWAIAEAARRHGVRAKCHLKIDSGMGRLGVPLADAGCVLQELARAGDAVDAEGIFTHLPMAYEPLDPFTARQIDDFANLVHRLEERGARFKYRHIAASDAINNFPQTFREPFNLVRTGINLHGSFDPNGRRELELESVLALKTRIAQVRTLPPGVTLGYGRTWCLNKEAKIATISAGYADGLPLALSNRGYVIVRGCVCPIVGRISMDYTTVDVSGVEGEVSAGDEVTCLGGEITPDAWARLKGTHAYDIICSLGNRVERIFVD
ncbi:MAG: alanine racemase [Kiritimatiellae bacterium]|nr:alanine racemase [Kiritimatiellia bacterium]